MKEKRSPRFSIRLKILIFSILTNVVVCAVMGFAIYGFVQESYIQTECEDTLAICRIAAYEINGNLLNLLEEGSDDSYANTVVQEEMQKILDSANLYAIYTIGERGGNMVYLSQPADYGYEIGKAISSRVSVTIAFPSSFCLSSVTYAFAVV